MSQDQVVRKRESSNNIAVETVKLFDFDDEAVIDKLVQSVMEMEAEELVQDILNLLSDSEMSTNTRKLRAGLKQLLKDPQHLKDSPKTSQKRRTALPNGIIKLLKANMAVDDKKNILEKVFEKVNQIESLAEDKKFQEFPAVPREARFTSESFPYESLLTNAPNEQIGKKHDFSNCEVQPDGSCCISKVRMKSLLS